MEFDLYSYITQLQLVAFFSGYPLIYALTHFIANPKRKSNSAKTLTNMLPYAYALSASLFLGLLLKDLYSSHSLVNISSLFTISLKTWGITGVVFWIPFINRRRFLSLLHSLPFLFIIMQDLFLHTGKVSGNDIIQNDMKVYTTSLLLNGGTLMFVVLLKLVSNCFKTGKKLAEITVWYEEDPPTNYFSKFSSRLSVST
jgi:hypothetical protein